MPHYNNSVGLEKLVDSILNENKDSIEIIIVDDKSNNKELEKLLLLETIYPCNVKIYKNETLEKGAGICRNIGIKHVSSKWTIFADSDDHFVEGYWKKIEEVLELDYEIIYFFPTSQNENGKTLNRHGIFIEPLTDYLNSGNINDLKCRITVVWSKMYQTSFIKTNNLFFDNTMVSNDVLFAVKSDYAANKIFVSRSTIYSWNLNTKSLTTKMSKERFEIVTDVFIRKNSFIKKKFKKKSSIVKNISGFKLIVFSLFRYKYGFIYTCNLIKKLRSAEIPLITSGDFKTKNVIRFIQNNTMYKKD